MKINIFEKGAHALLEDALLRTLRQVYTGNGLYVEIDQISLDYIEDEDTPLITARIRFGRYEEGSKLNFQETLEIEDINEDLDLSFFTGRFFQHLATTEPELEYTKE